MQVPQARSFFYFWATSETVIADRSLSFVVYIKEEYEEKRVLFATCSTFYRPFFPPNPRATGGKGNDKVNRQPSFFAQ